MNLNLKELLSVPGCPVALHGNVDSTQVARHIRGVEIDSRKVVPGTLFIAIRGERLDGHQFIPDAIKQGVAAMVVDEAWFNQTRDPHLDGLFLVVADTLVALQEFSKFYRRKFSIPVIGLTGSVGKTTTKEMLAAVLSQKYNVHKNEGNLNNHYGVPLTLFKIAENHEIAIIEMGANHFGEIARLAEIAEPTHAIITAVGRAHLEFFGSLEGVARAKLELFDAIKDSGLAFVNADDARIESNVPALKRQIRFGFENDADIKGRIVNIDTNGCVTFDLRGQQIQLRTPGVHQAKNALAAAAVALEFGIDIRQIKEALEAYAPVSKRMEVIDIQGIRIINDCYNSNPDSANSALDVLNGMETSGQKISVMADMLELGQHGEAEHRGIGERVGQLNIDALYGFGPMTRFTVEAAKPALTDRSMFYDDKRKLAEDLIQFLRDGDIVLIKGSRGMAMEEVTDAIKKHFGDRVTN